VAAERADAVWLTADQEFSLADFAELSGLPEETLRELVDYGAIAPVDPDAPQWMLPGKCLPTVRAACRLRMSFDLDPHGVALVISLLDRIHDLEAQMSSLHAQLPRRAR
jgi:chaperone modulatory protein CbpM